MRRNKIFLIFICFIILITLVPFNYNNNREEVLFLNYLSIEDNYDLISNAAPTSNQPSNITTHNFGYHKINWILYDDVGPGQYRVWVNDINGNYYVWVDWASWINATSLNVPINWTSFGTFNYTIEFNDSSETFGTPDSVFVSIIPVTYWSNISIVSDDYTGWNTDNSDDPSIAVDNNGVIHVVWYDETQGEWYGGPQDWEIMYANYTEGLGWSNATVISDDYTGWNIGRSVEPSIAIDTNGIIHVVWEDWTVGEWGGGIPDYEIMYTNYTSSGWSNATVISDNSGWNNAGSRKPQIACDSYGNVHVVWTDYTDGWWGTDAEIMYTNYTTAGWSNATVISDDYTIWNNGTSQYPDIEIDYNGNLHVVWEDWTIGKWGGGSSDREIMYANYTASGWSNATVISDDHTGWNNDGSYFPSIAIDRTNNKHVVWADHTDGVWGTNIEIWYTKSTTSGWSNATLLSDNESNWNIGDNRWPRIAIDENFVHVVWEDFDSGNVEWEIMYTYHIMDGWSNPTVISDNETSWNGYSNIPDLITDNNGNIHLVWYDGTDGWWGTDYEIMYRKLIKNYPPSSNHPLNIITSSNGTETINWTLYDDYGSGMYRVWVNDSNNNYYIWRDWNDWMNNTPLDIDINRTAPGIYNYTIEYNDSSDVFRVSDPVIVTIIDAIPTSNHPNNFTTPSNGTETINWTLFDDFGPGKYCVWLNDTNDIYYVYINWTDWANNTQLNITVNRSASGVYNYTIQYNDSYGNFGIPNTVIVTITDNMPTSNNPNNITMYAGEGKTINWILDDDYDPGYYRIWANDTNDNYYVWRDCSPWIKGASLNVPINETAVGIFNYTIEYNDSAGLMGIPNTVIVNITGNIGQKIRLTPVVNYIYQFSNDGFMWMNITINVLIDTNITMTTNLSKPLNFANFTVSDAFVYYEIDLDNPLALINATIRFVYNESKFNYSEEDLRIYRYDIGKSSWILLDGNVNTTANYIEIFTTSLSDFILGLKPAEKEPSLFFLPPAGDNLALIIGIVILSAAVVGIIIYALRKRGKLEEEPIEKYMREAKLEVKRAYDYVGGNIRFKVVVKNNSTENLHDISVDLNVKEQFEVDSNIKTVKILEPNESSGVDFILTPLTCGTSNVKADISYKDAKGKLSQTMMKTALVQIKCPLVQPKLVKLEDFQKLKKELQKSHSEITYSDLNISTAYEIAREQILSLDVTELDKNEEIKYALYSGEAKVGRELIIIELNVKSNAILIDIYLRDLKQATGFLAYLKNLISLALKYSKQISTTLDKITNKIYNAFEFGYRLLELFKLCDAKEPVDDLLLIIKELSIKSSSYFPDLKISDSYMKWKQDLEKLEGKEVWERTYLNLQYDILDWMEKIITYSETNAKTYSESPNADEETQNNINSRNSQLKVLLDLQNKQYSKKILFTLMLINKTNGISMYTHNFTEKTIDPDLIGGFLTAIQSFGMEIPAEAEETAMNKLSYKHFEIELQEGKYTIAALITSGMPNKLTLDRQTEFLNKFEKEFERDLEKFVGDVSCFREAEKLVNEIFLKE